LNIIGLPCAPLYGSLVFSLPFALLKKLTKKETTTCSALTENNANPVILLLPLTYTENVQRGYIAAYAFWQCGSRVANKGKLTK